MILAKIQENNFDMLLFCIGDQVRHPNQNLCPTGLYIDGAMMQTLLKIHRLCNLKIYFHWKKNHQNNG